MRRFLMLVGVAVVAAAMYVAASPAGQQATGPTAKQFKALKKQVTALKKQVATAKKDALAGLGVSLLCIMHQPIGVDQVGNSTDGYLFGPPQTAPNVVNAAATTALNLAPSGETSPQHDFYELNTSQPTCVQLAQQASTLTLKRAVAAYAATH